jgi:ribonuclease P/MRP protein subunit RPP40
MFMDSLTEASDSGLIFDVIFLDLAKAFDSVPHVPLIHKLTAYGIEGEVLEWIKGFLSERSFNVKIDSTLSSSSPVTSGVPQGSVLGPLLFLIYVNDLPDVISNLVILYADDLTVLSSGDPSILQISVDGVQSWSDDWGLPINASKCAHMSFGGDSGNAFVIHGSTEVMCIQKQDKKIF